MSTSKGQYQLSEEEFINLATYLGRFLSSKGMPRTMAQEIVVDTILEAKLTYNPRSKMSFKGWCFKKLFWAKAEYFKAHGMEQQELYLEDNNLYRLVNGKNAIAQKEKEIDKAYSTKISHKAIITILKRCDNEERAYFSTVIFKRISRKEIIKDLKLSENKANAIKRRLDRLILKVLKEMNITHEDLDYDYLTHLIGT